MDFGKHVIPSYLENNDEVYAYSFDGYWKDVGTIQSLWETSMEFLEPDFELDIHDTNWQIYTRYQALPPQYVTQNAEISHAMVVDGCVIDGKVTNSVLSEGVKVKANASVDQSLIMANADIGENAKIQYAIIGEQAVVKPNAQVIGDENNIIVVGFQEVIEA